MFIAGTGWVGGRSSGIGNSSLMLIFFSSGYITTIARQFSDTEISMDLAQTKVAYHDEKCF